VRCVKLSLRSRQLECYEYADSPNPPILDRKECFLLPDDERYPRFARLTEQEERQGLLAEPATIGSRDGWEMRLRQAGFLLKGHRLCHARTVDSGSPPTKP
jgi:hypothetical protein